MSYDFSTETPGKCIIAGEHAVLRSTSALVFPVHKRTLKLKYWDSHEAVRAEFTGESGNDMHILFWSLVEHGLELINYPLSNLKGRFVFESNIPIGAGMGASAALCVCTARWFNWKGLVPVDKLFDFARELENLFHGKSSGLDIAAVMSNNGLRFKRNQQAINIKPNWQPDWYLSFSEQLSMTSHSIKKVNEILHKDPIGAKQIDKDMAESVEMAEQALMLTETQGITLLADAINKAANCFRKWGLTEGKVETHMNQLLKAGACAVKPIGSGDGGFILSLWPHPATEELPFELIPLKIIF